MARKKSTLDIAIQWGRIFDNLERDADGRLTSSAQQRYNRAFDTYQRYDRNIRKSRPYRAAYNKAYDRAFEGTMIGATPSRYSVARAAGDMAGVQVKVSRVAYMGLANG